jgi:hypothetical protein
MTAGGLTLPAVRAFGASDFWNKKQAAEWTPQEIETLKTKSPWAKKVYGEAGRGGGGGGAEGGGPRGDAIAGAESSGGGGGGRGGGGGGRRGGGGDGGGGSGGGSTQDVEVVIRWESAAPVLAATKFHLPDALAEHYAVSITGLPPQMVAMIVMGRGGGRGRAGAGEGEAPRPADPKAEAKARQERLLHAATLAAKGHDPQTPDVVLQTSDQRTLIFGFAKANLPLAATDKDVQFVFRAGQTAFKARFEPKEMMYKGELTV